MANFGIKAVFNVGGNAEKRFQAISAAARPIARQIEVVKKNFANLTGPLGKLASPFMLLGGTASIAGLGAMVKKTAEFGDVMSKTIQKVGFGSAAYQEYAYAAKLCGMSTEEFNSNIGFLTKNMGQLRAGTGPLVAGISKISPVLADQLKNTKTNEEAFELLIKAIQKVEDPVKKAYIAQQAFGRGGQSMVLLANQGSDGIAKLRKEAQDLGIVMEDSALTGSESFLDSLERLNTAGQGLAQTITAKLLPIFEPIIEKMTKWVVANQDLIATKIGSFIEKIGEAVSKIDFDKVGAALTSIIGRLFNLAKTIATCQPLLYAFGAAVAGIKLFEFATLLGSTWTLIKTGGPLLTQIAGSIGGLAKAFIGCIPSIVSFGAAMLTCPITWIVAGIAAVAAGAVMLYKNWDSVTAFFGKTWDTIKGYFKAGWDFIEPIIKAISDPLGALKSGASWLAKKIGIGGDDEEDEDKPDQPEKKQKPDKKNEPEKETAAPEQYDMSGEETEPEPELKPERKQSRTIAENLGNLKDGASWLADRIENTGDEEKTSEDYPTSEDEKTPRETTPENAIPIPPPIGNLADSNIAARTATESKSEVTVRFENMPKEARVEQTVSDNATDLGVEFGYSF